MFEELEMAPPDPILDLKVAFKEDPNPAKIDLTAGVYKDDEGNTPIFHAVKLAEARLLELETDKSYLSIEGSAEYAAVVQALLFGQDHQVIADERAVTAHTPGGTGALRVAGDLIRRIRPEARVWVSDPTWPNHPNVFRAAGLAVETYPYFDPATNGLAFDRMLEALGRIPQGDVVLLHACCHNPTGIDPTPEQWARIAEVIEAGGSLPLLDFAYQGLGDGIREDAVGLLTLCRPGRELLVASSFSKNFGLYKERAGALTLVAPSREVAQAALSHMKRCIRANYSNPPAHGAAIVTTVLNDPELRARWEEELKAMCDRINRMRHLLVETLAAKGVTRDFSFIERQRGMFSFSGLTEEQVGALRRKHAIYMVGNGRINVAGINEANVDRLCRAIADVL